MDLLRRWDMVCVLCGCGVLALLLAACGESRLADSGVVVRDSADVRIIESSREHEFRSLSWRISEDPDLVIGVSEGAEEYQLFAVEGASVLSNGWIAVVNGGTQEIRFFDEEGQYIESTGGRGDGPGEFQMPQLVRPVTGGGELLIWDLMLNRFTLLGPNGNVLRTVRPEAVVRTVAGWNGSRVVLSFRSSATAGVDTSV